MNLQDQIKRVQELTQHKYTRAELKEVHKLVNEVRDSIGQPTWAIPDEQERDELQEMIINYAIAEYYRSPK